MDDHALDTAEPHLGGIDLLADVREERALIFGSASAPTFFDLIDNRAHLWHASSHLLDADTRRGAGDLAVHRHNAALDMNKEAMPARAVVVRQRLRDSDLDLPIGHDLVRNRQHTTH